MSIVPPVEVKGSICYHESTHTFMKWNGEDWVNVKRALISVSSKKNLNILAPFLIEQGFDIFSTGGTLKYLKQHKVKAFDISSYTNFPEMMDGRLKTLHPLVHGGILGRRSIDDEIMIQHNIIPFELVVVNLYDFEGTISKPGIQLEEAIENIDIGGPTMLRSAAKNYKDVTVMCNPDDYVDYMALYTKNNLTESIRLKFAQKVFAHTAKYDDTISKYLYHTTFK